MKSMKRRYVVLLVLVMVFSLSITAFADSAYSDEKYATVKGYTYCFFSVISNNTPGKIYAQTSLFVDGSGTAPTGYMGARARVYNSAGRLLNYTDWVYNTSEAGSVFAYASFYQADEYYYSKGQVQLYNGKAYTTYDCYSTPNYTVTRSFPDTQIQRNENGEIYGSEYFLGLSGIQPDLIIAEGTGGTIGYVRAAELNIDGVSSPDDVSVYQETLSPRTIPLYESDGETIIGSFVVGNTSH